MVRIVVLDGYRENPGDLSWEALAALGELTVYDRTPAELVTARIAEAEVVYTSNVPLSRADIEASPQLRMIGILATGYDSVDTEAARERGVVVTNIPAYSTASVSQFAIALLLEICHHIGHHDRVVHEGAWTQDPDWCFWDYPLIELADKTLGVIGFGRIGQRTGRMAQALGMRVQAYDPVPDPTLTAAGFHYVELDQLFATSDVIALHCPLTAATEGLINSASIARMKDGVIIINNSRGQLIVEQDLCHALNSGKVYAAGLDVASSEPISSDNPLLKAKNCLITPHISWAPRESRQRLMATAVENLRQFLAGTPINVVNQQTCQVP